jgi:hypothetical protein
VNKQVEIVDKKYILHITISLIKNKFVWLPNGLQMAVSLNCYLYICITANILEMTKGDVSEKIQVFPFDLRE